MGVFYLEQFYGNRAQYGAHTDTGQWIFGIFVGSLTVIIRGINPAYPEGIMLAILLMNAFAPLIDYCICSKQYQETFSPICTVIHIPYFSCQ